MEDYE
jgi:hypothetical protein